MEKVRSYHNEPHSFSLATPTREYILRLLEQLPTLDEVLQRKSRPPVCLYNYYIILRDRLHMEYLLDFWLDVQQAEVLYRRYMKQQQKKLNKKTLSSTTINTTTNNNNNNNNNNNTTANMTDQPEILTQLLLLQSSSPSLFSTTTAINHNHNHNNNHNKRSTMNTMSSTANNSNSSQSSLPQHQPSEIDLIDTIERIYLHYIVPHAEKELIQLPTNIRDQIIKSFTQQQQNGSGIENPIIFQHAKRYVQILLEYSFTLFIRYKVFMNLTLPQQIGRLGVGFLSLLIGFTLEFSLIFLNISPWSKRLWGIIPISVAVYCLCSSICGLDPIWVLFFNISETTTFKFNAIKQTKVRNILRQRSISLLIVMIILITTLLIIFCSIPGKRL
ncbi:hypothetical protein BJ944DRAFT_203882 [Cunninghamella echinulata]|nr:hypothetical protein BJ944DRAFT_203882 [Cunninghamella echinulata]